METTKENVPVADNLQLTVTERKIVLFLRSMQYGTLTVIIKDGHPVHVKQERTLKLE